MTEHQQLGLALPRKLLFVPARREHIALLVLDLRDDDAAECEAVGLLAEDWIGSSLDGSIEAWTALEDGYPIAMWGLTTPDLLGFKACPWMLTGRGVERWKRTLMRESAAFIARVSLLYPYLSNRVDARYSRALRWVRWLGFDINKPEPYGPRGALFCHVEKGHMP